jgi:hypothetical protein
MIIDNQYVYVKKIKIRNLPRLTVGNAYFCRGSVGNNIGVYLTGWTKFEHYAISYDEFKEHFGNICEVRKEKLKKINESSL